MLDPPSDAIIAVTHRCNARCVMCNIWKSTDADRLEPAHMTKLPATLRTVNLSGGEPFLREDLPEFVRVIRQHCPAATITISTNAFLPDRIESMMAEIRQADPGVRLAISLDGLGETHDTIRGSTGAFDRAMRLIEDLRATGYVGLRLSMTVSKHNADQVVGVADLAQRLGLELGIVAAHGARTHLGIDEEQLGRAPDWLADTFSQVASRLLRSWRPKQWLRGHFAAMTYRYLSGRPWKVACHAGRDFVFLQADGTVYHCSVEGKAMGDLVDDAWEELWASPAADAARSAARHCPRSCWMICTARSVYRAHPLAVAAWIATHKPLAHLRRLHLTPPARSVDAHPAD